MRIVLLHYTFPSVVGGVEAVLARHASALVAARAEVTVAAGRGRLTIRGARAARIPELDSRHPLVERTFRALARGEIPAELERLRARLRDRLRPLLVGSDRVVVHNALTLHKNAPLALALHDLAPAVPAGRVIAWTHDLAWTDPRYARQRHAGEPWDVFARPMPGARYVAVSESRRDEASGVLGLSRQAITVVPNGLDVAPLLRLAPATSRLLATLDLAGTRVLLLPARLTRRKRIEVAIDAAALLRRRGDRVTLLVTGGPGSHNAENARYLTELHARAAAARGAAVLLHDVAGALPYRVVIDLFGVADALIFPSEHEGFGIPLLEAALLRVPIIASDIPAHRAIAGDDATYVPSDAEAPALADAIARTLAGDRAARLRARARDEYDWERILKERVLPVILGQDRARRSA